MKRAALFVGGLFFFPRFGSASGQDQARGRPRHPFEGIRIKNSRELEGEERARTVQQTLNSRDVRNVQNESPAALDTAEAIAVSHELEDGNTLLAVAFPTNAGVVAYYQAAQPIDHYATLAWMYVVEDEATARLVSASVNGRTFALSGRAGESLESNCGGCVFPYLDYDCWQCTSVDIGCAAECCGLCSGCGSNPACWLVCLLTWCIFCVDYCCNSWQLGCCPCGP